MDNSKANKIFVKSAFSRFFIPSVLSSLGLAVGALADCLFVGSQIGSEGLAIIGFGAPIYSFYSLISIGISTGASIHYSMAMSEGNEKKGQEIFLNTLLFIFIIISALSVLGYIFLPQVLSGLGVPAGSVIYPQMKQYATAQLCLAPIMFMQAPFYYFVHCDNNPKLAAFALVSANILDIVLNYMFIIVLKVGITGAVYSTAFAALLTISICLSHLFSKKTVLRFGRFHISFRHVVHGIITGYATNAQFAYEFIVILLFNQILMKLSGENGVACLDVALSIAALVIAVIEGTGLTLQPMIATFYGERNAQNIKSTLRYSFLCGGLVCTILVLSIVFLAPEYCHLFGLSEGEALNNGVWAIRIIMVSIPVRFVVAQMNYYYQSVNKEKFAYALIFFSDAFGRILFGILLAGLGIHAFWFCYVCSELLAMCILLLYCLHKKTVLFLDFKEVVFTSLLENCEEKTAQTIEQIQEFCELQGASVKQAYFLTLAVDEMCTAIFRREAKNHLFIQLTIICEGKENFTLHLRDNNETDFNPFDTNTSDFDSEASDENAIGMKLVKNKAKEFYYRQYSGFNTLVVKI